MINHYDTHAMKNTAVLLLVILISNVHALFGQTFRALSEGDTLPALNIRYLNHRVESGNTLDYRGKVLVLYFWNTHCLACLSSLPKLESLNDQYRERFTILPVINDFPGTENKYRNFYEMRKERNMEVRLPTVIDDSTLYRLFPHRTLPHVVWIDENGVVISNKSSGASLTSDLIEAVIDKKPVILPVKASLVQREYAYDGSMPYLVAGNGGDGSEFTHRSVLGPENPAVRGSGNLYFFSENGHTKLFAANCSVSELYLRAYEMAYPNKFRNTFAAKFMQKGVVVETEKPIAAGFEKIRLAAQGKLPHEEIQYYCYELNMPGGMDNKNAAEKMIRNLDGFFGVRSCLEKREIEVFELTKADSLLTCLTNHPDARSATQVVRKSNTIEILATNVPIAAMLGSINNKFDLPFLVDRTGLTANIDAKIPITEGTEFTDLKRALQSMGFKLSKTRVIEEVLVIVDE